MSVVFYLHEDDWGMVAVMPAENMPRSEEVAREAEAFGQEHFDGTGWTDVYVVPEEEHPISERRIELAELRALVGGRLVEAADVTSGYGTFAEVVGRGFAFGEAYGETGAFYGWADEGVIMRLNLILPDGNNAEAVGLFVEVLRELWRNYRLIIADWWSNRVIDPGDEDGLREYLAERGEGSEAPDGD